MTQVDVEVEEAPNSESPSEVAAEVAEAIVEAQVEAAEELQQEAELEHAEEVAVEALERATDHDHPEYSPVGHSHPELDVSAQLSAIEGRLGSLEQQFSEQQTVEVEEIEPTTEKPPDTEPTRRKYGFKRGR